MQENILPILRQMEKQEEVKILYACDAGSRAKGIASATSDYDVRFLYIHRQEFYLSIDPPGYGKRRDVLDRKIGNLYDFHGWEMAKALRLFRKSNPSLLEWLHSELIFYEPYAAIAKMRDILPAIFNPKACMMHYLKMAKANFKKHKQQRDQDIKLALNVIRPILASFWIYDHKEFPPVPLQMLLPSLPEGIVKDQIQLLILKKISPADSELALDWEILHSFILKTIHDLEAAANTLAVAKSNVTPLLNRLFRETLAEVWSNSSP